MKKKEMARVISTLQDYVDKLETENQRLKLCEHLLERKTHTNSTLCENNEVLTDTLRGVLLELAAARESLAIPNGPKEQEAYDKISGIIDNINNAFEDLGIEK